MDMNKPNKDGEGRDDLGIDSDSEPKELSLAARIGIKAVVWFIVIGIVALISMNR